MQSTVRPLLIAGSWLEQLQSCIRNKLRRFVFRLVKYALRTMHFVFARRGHGNDIIFIQFDSALGWAIHETPVYYALKQARPDCRITVACGNLVYSVIKRNPYVDSVLILPDPHQEFVRSSLFMLSKTLFHRYESVITTAFNRQPRRVFLALLSGARNCFGFTDVSDVYDDVVKYDIKLCVTKNNLNCLLPLNIESANDDLRIYFSDENYKAASEIFAKVNINSDLSICVFITQTSGGQPSNWWPDRFAQLADQLHRDSGLQIVFIGSKADVVEIEKIRALMVEPSASVAGMTDIQTLAAVMCMSDIAVTVDTGPMHIGTAVGLPMVLIASAWQSPHEWLPVGSPKVLILRSNDIPCKECYKFYCATRECMEDIGVHHVYANVVHMLAAYPPTPSDRLQRVRNSTADGPGPKLL